MDRPYVERLHLEECGCVRDVHLRLTPLHALIGPNDSGKTTILRAIHEVAAQVHARAAWHDAKHRDARVTFGWGDTEAAFLATSANVATLREGANTVSLALSEVPTSERLAPLRGSTFVRWDPDEICAAARPIPEHQAFQLGERGRGMPAAYEALLSRDRDAFAAIEAKVHELFPSVRRIWLPTTSQSEKQLGVELIDGTKVPGDQLSEGLVYWLAFAILPYAQPRPLLLIEEPENGLHPSRIAEVMRVLREVAKTTQILIATHSPLVINELAPEEVTLLTRDLERGTIATPIAETTAFRAREKVYALGELWLSFADGLNESALVDPAKRPTGT
ncbi:MAG: AAA family ATPase [Deltaproteobacteria bacterium]|nr:AAA family ATPase [Deltaproteobacteria bacterium]